ncbi:MAG: DUF1009 domain-containing protein [Proteobacteria bacterium]|nr:MAG: DUF1009 domain-containing protein [Pseudomonadota bacterium]
MAAAVLSSPLGLIAGSGILPIEIAKSARSKGLKVVTIAHIGETDPRVAEMSEDCLWLKVGQLKRTLKFLKQSQVKQVAFAGAIAKAKLFRNFRPDLKALAILARLAHSGDDAVLRGVTEEIEKAGFEVIGMSELLRESTPSEGLLTLRDFTPQELQDAALGWRAAKALGSLDIGQTVIVRKGVIVAVEALEGTDAAIRRAGEIAGEPPSNSAWLGKVGGALNAWTSATSVMVKLAKPQQDLRIDQPTIGENTIELMHGSGISALLIEAGKTLILHVEQVVALADKYGIAIRAAVDMQNPI